VFIAIGLQNQPFQGSTVVVTSQKVRVRVKKSGTFVSMCAMSTMHETTKHTDAENSRRRKIPFHGGTDRNYRAPICCHSTTGRAYPTAKR